MAHLVQGLSHDRGHGSDGSNSAFGPLSRSDDGAFGGIGVVTLEVTVACSQFMSDVVERLLPNFQCWLWRSHRFEQEKG